MMTSSAGRNDVDPKRQDAGFLARDILMPIEGISADTPCGEVVTMMLAESDLPCLAIVNDANRPLGIVEREQLLSTFAHQLKSELYRRRPIRNFLDEAFLVVDEATSLDEISALIAEHHPRALAGGFVITRGGRYIGVGTGIRLLSRTVAQTTLRAAELEAARAAAEAANRAKSTFLASMSHEIRTPLNGVIGNLELLCHAEGDAERNELIGSANASAQTLLQIIGDVLDFSKIESDRIALEITAFDPAVPVREAAAVFASRARQRGLWLAVHIGAGIPRSVRGDPLRLRQIVMNFIGNAVKFTERGGVAVALRRVWTETDAPRLRIEVCDTGPGFAPEKAEALFEAFTQEDDSTARRFGGTGLGLAICRKLAALMCGAVGADGTPGNGATFWFEFPVQDAGEEGASDGDARVPLDGARVLLFDGADGEGGGNLAAKPLLEADGAQVETAGSLVTGIAALRAAGKPFDAVVLDARLPDGDGFVIAELVAGTPTRLLMTVPAHDPALARAAYRRGFARTIVRPCPPEEIRQAVAAIVGRAPVSVVEEGAPGALRNFAERCGGRPVLVVDDTPMNLAVARRQLQKLGVPCQVASNGLEALELATMRPYALILVDRSMPVMDGNSFARHLRAWEARHGARTPLIAMTAHALADDVRASAEAGMDDHLTKPVSLDRLSAILDRWLGPAGMAPVPDTPPPDPDESPIDFGKLSTILGGADEEERREVLAFFAESFPGLMERLDVAFAAADAPAVASAAHAAKGAARNIGAVRLGDVLAVIEARAPSADWPLLRTLLAEADAGFKALIGFIQRY